MAARRWPKRLLIAAAVGGALLAAAYAALLYAFPPQRLAELLAEQVRTRTGREFRIDGPLSLQLLPRVGVVARELRFGNAGWGTKPHMLSVSRAELQVELMPLLQRRIEVERVVLDGVEALFETDREGRGNWLMQGRAAAATRGDDSGATLQLDLPRVQVSNARLRYRDGRSGKVTELALDSLQLSRDGDSTAWQAQFGLGKQAWQLEGRSARLATLAANRSDWPFDLQLNSRGAKLQLQGKLLSGATPRTLRGHLAAGITSADVLAPWIDAPPPLPLALRTDLHYSGTTVKLDALTLSLAGQQLSGRMVVADGNPWRIDATLSSPAIDVAKLLPKGRGKSAAAPAEKKLFDARPINFLALNRLPASVVLSVDQLLIPGAPPLSALKLKFDAGAKRASFEPLSFAVAGGTVRGGVSAQFDNPAAPRLKVQLAADNLSAETLSRAAGGGDYVRGGSLHLRTDLSLSGGNSAALAASASGELLISAKDLRLGDGAAPIGPNLLPRILKAVRLQPTSPGATHVECAVVRLPFRNGVAEVDRSIAVQTPELSLVAKGLIDLRDETMQLALRPSTRGALGINPAQLASLVLLKGPLLDPGLSLDVHGAANMALTIGAAAASGGLSLLGQNLLRQASDPEPCKSAATGVKGTAAAVAPTTPTAKPENPFRKLFK